MGKSFKRIVASSVGSFGENTEKIPQWIRANGGTYSKDVNSSTTHLIASEAAVKKNFDPSKFPIETIRKSICMLTHSESHSQESSTF
jgi:hypothetical protein